ncbi:Glycosyltransferase, DXD sugar-binding motif [Dillenia turbinata]|uniref:Glycosyltransferase, DXD sugar-binding motif n=1 Tax=Dillenia turbinata TaxID=194707 RepID=A0AAN8ZJ26_9MAGN
MSSGCLPLLSLREDVEESYREEHHLLPPLNVSEKERIAWFRKTLPEFQIFKKNDLTKQFDSRVQAFFNNSKCEFQFFMTWISPARSFREREFFAMESLFKAHPWGCLLILSRTMDSQQGYRILMPLLDFGFRVLAVTPDLYSLFKKTPAEAWLHQMKKGKNDPGEIPLAQNLSNLLRLAALYKYGGVYLDTDFIVLKMCSGLRNSIGAQSMDMVTGKWTRLNNAVLIFDKNHPLLFKFIEEFALTFDGNKWRQNGPYMVSRVVERVAKRLGYNFTVLPLAFYPVDWTRISGFCAEPRDEAAMKWIEAKLLQLSGETYAVHLWNKQSSRLTIEKGSIINRLVSDNRLICESICTAEVNSNGSSFS